MSPHLPLSFSMLVAALAMVPAAVSAQFAPKASLLLVREASAMAGRLHGTVVDEAGARIDGVSIVVAGATLAAATSDGRGQFNLSLPVGQYLVRAQRAGYLSPNAVFIRVPASGRIERNITLTRALAVEQVPAASADGAPADKAGAAGVGGQGDVAWRLRHLSRTVLREVAPTHGFEDGVPSGPARWEPDLSLLDKVVQSSMRTAASFFSNLSSTDFTAQVNLLTTGSVLAATEPGSTDWSRGIADVVVGAPVGTSGAWSVRGAVASGDTSSWTLLGEYRSRGDRPHAPQLSVSYSTQGFSMGQVRPQVAAIPESRSVGGMHVSDRWQVRPSLQVDYGLRLDRFDYLAKASLFSPRVGVRARVAERTFAVASVSQRMVAPGAEEFLPPAEAGPWLPPTRTFSALSSRHGLGSERVRQQTIGMEHRLSRTRTAALQVEWFSQSVADQFATLYGLDGSTGGGHYDIARAGDVDVIGWRVRLGGELVEHVHGTFEYATGAARWSGTRMTGELRRHVPALARRGTDHVSDVGASVEVRLPRTATHISVAYRRHTADRRGEVEAFDRIGKGRFNVELRQRLPYQPLSADTLNLLFSLRTLVYEDESGSFYDELLTLQPPMRVTGGLQVRF